MFQWITELKLLLETERIIRRDRHLPADLHLINAAGIAALERFPDDAINQEAIAGAELYGRRLRGLPIHDA